MLISHRMTRLLCAGALVLAVPKLASCAKEKATDEIYTPANAANYREGQVKVLNAVIVSSGEGSGTFVATLVNNETNQAVSDDDKAVSGDDKADQLVGLGGDVTAKLPQPVDIPASGIAVLAKPAGKGIKVTGDFKPGDFVTVTLTFKNAGEATLQVPVVEDAGEWEGQNA
jgi:copper(I)-binding protein